MLRARAAKGLLFVWLAWKLTLLLGLPPCPSTLGEKLCQVVNGNSSSSSSTSGSSSSSNQLSLCQLLGLKTDHTCFNVSWWRQLCNRYMWHIDWNWKRIKHTTSRKSSENWVLMKSYHIVWQTGWVKEELQFVYNNKSKSELANCGLAHDFYTIHWTC